MSKLTITLLLPVLFLAACGSEKSSTVALPSNAKPGWTSDNARELLNCKVESDKVSQSELDTYCKCMADNITPKYTPAQVEAAKKTAEAGSPSTDAADMLAINQQCNAARKGTKSTGSSSLPTGSGSGAGLPSGFGGGEIGGPGAEDKFGSPSGFPSGFPSGAGSGAGLPSGFPSGFGGLPGSDHRGIGEGDPLPPIGSGSSSSSSFDLKYSITLPHCKTGEKRFFSQEALCSALQSEKENDGCGKDTRKSYFKAYGCTGTFTERP